MKRFNLTPPLNVAVLLSILWVALILDRHRVAASFTNLNDSGSDSLRNAVASASPGDTINFSVTGTITLTSGEIAMTFATTRARARYPALSAGVRIICTAK